MNNILAVNQIDEVRGGSDRCFFSTNELLRNNGYEVIPFSSSKAAGQFPKEINFENRSISNSISYFYNFEAKTKLDEMIVGLDADIDLAHLHIYYGKLTSSILSVFKKKNIPIVQTLHEFKLSCPVYTHISNDSICNKCVTGSSVNCLLNKCKNGSLVSSLVRFLEYNISRFLGDVDKIDKFICVSNFQKDKMIEAGIPKEKLVTIYNFVDSSMIPREVVDGDYLLFFGRLERLKGVHTLIESMTLHREKKLIIAGNGAYENELRSLTQALNLEGNVEFVGFKQGEELWSLVRNCKAVMVPSEWYENCSMTVLEAKAYSKPVIGAAIGGITEQIHDGLDGFLHDAGNVESLSEAIYSLYKAEYSIVAANSRSDLESRYSKDVHYEKLKQTYQEAINGRSN